MGKFIMLMSLLAIAILSVGTMLAPQSPAFWLAGPADIRLITGSPLGYQPAQALMVTVRVRNRGRANSRLDDAANLELPFGAIRQPVIPGSQSGYRNCRAGAQAVAATG
jgi:hypothetical protein